MSSEWPEVTLKDVTTVLGDGLHGTPEYDDEGDYYFINGNNLSDGEIVFTDKTRRVSEEEYQKHRKNLNDRTILVSINGTLGNVALYGGEKVVLGKSACYFNVRDDVNKNFVRFVVSGNVFQDYIHSLATGSTIKNVSLKLMRDFRFNLPPIDEQNKIVDVLGALDGRIKLLRETNATLEAIAQALFKSWFVDFDPVRAKMEGQAPEGMDEATAALFPDSFEDSELGLVPKGWSLIPFGQLLSHTIGGDWGGDAPDDKNDTRVAIVRGTDIPDLQGGTNGRVPIRYTTGKKLASRRVQADDIVIEVSGGSKDQPTGRSLQFTDALLGLFDSPVEPASFCRLLRPRSAGIAALLGQHLKYIYEQGKTWEYQNQSTGIANFQTSHFLEAELVAVPPQEVLSKFEQMVRPIMDRIHLSQIRELASLRDTLLPRLISGQLRLSEN